jgi:hypothetical protein
MTEHTRKLDVQGLATTMTTMTTMTALSEVE